jgi:hypothetical protein
VSRPPPSVGDLAGGTASSRARSKSRGKRADGRLPACVLDFEVDSLSGFLKAWLAATLLIVGYAWVDLHAHPHLAFETSFTLTPDASRLSDLLNWGGRLLRHGAVGLLLANAIALGGILALLGRGALAVIHRLRTTDESPRVSIVPASVPTSVPPPRP